MQAVEAQLKRERIQRHFGPQPNTVQAARCGWPATLVCNARLHRRDTAKPCPAAANLFLLSEASAAAEMLNSSKRPFAAMPSFLERGSTDDLGGLSSSSSSASDAESASQDTLPRPAEPHQARSCWGTCSFHVAASLQAHISASCSSAWDAESASQDIQRRPAQPQQARRCGDDQACCPC